MTRGVQTQLPTQVANPTIQTWLCFDPSRCRLPFSLHPTCRDHLQETAHRPVSLRLRASQPRHGMCRETLLSLCPAFLHTPGTAQAALDLNSETKFKSWFRAFSCESLGLASVSHPLVCKLAGGMLLPRDTFRAPPSLCSTQVMPLGV